MTLQPALDPNESLKEIDGQSLPAHDPAVAKLCIRLQTVEARLDNYMKHFPGVFFSQQADLAFRYIGPGFDKLAETESKPFQQSSSAFMELIHEDDREVFFAFLTNMPQDGQTHTVRYRIVLPETHEIRHVMDIRSARHSPSGLLMGYEGVWLDVTRQVKAEKMLNNSSWRETLANVTHGLSHDFSNIVAGIYTLSDLMESSIEADNPWKDSLSMIKTESLHAQKLVRRILELSQSTSGKKEVHSFSQLLNEQTDLIQAVAPKRVKVINHGIDEDVAVHLDETDFAQACLNLAVNAIDAMPDRTGQLELRARSVQQGGTIFACANGGATEAVAPGIELSIRDNGCGIPESVQKKIFNAFFTTKSANRGSGLGLYNIKLFIEECGGKIDFYSKPGEGTTFYLYLPAYQFDSVFNEKDELEIELPGTKCPRFLVYSPDGPECAEVTHWLRGREWEVIPLDDIDLAQSYLSDTYFPPHAAIINASSNIKETASFLRMLKRDFVQIPTVVLSNGQELDSLRLQLGELCDAIVEDDHDAKKTLCAIKNVLC